MMCCSWKVVPKLPVCLDGRVNLNWDSSYGPIKMPYLLGLLAVLMALQSVWCHRHLHLRDAYDVESHVDSYYAADVFNHTFMVFGFTHLSYSPGDVSLLYCGHVCVGSQPQPSSPSGSPPVSSEQADEDYFGIGLCFRGNQVILCCSIFIVESSNVK